MKFEINRIATINMQETLYYEVPKGIEEHFRANPSKPILVTHQNMADYNGMVLCLMIAFNPKNKSYILDLEWMCFGLDLYGDTLQESYQYAFKNLNDLIKYIDEKYQIRENQIPISYSIDQDLFPNPIKNANQKDEYKAHWKRFVVDFYKGKMLDKNLELVYSSTN